MPDAIVVGAGVIGTTTALYLAREGLSVQVVDGRAEAGLETSFANGGLVTPSTALPWCSPGVPGMLLRWIGREDAPLLLRPSAIPRLGLWGLKFLANCRPSKYTQSSRSLTRFARESLTETEALLAQRTVDYELSHGGLLELYRDDDGIATMERYAVFLEGLGVRTARLSAADCVALEPDLAPIAPTIRAALHLPDDAWGDARKFTLAVETSARERNVEFSFGTQVTRLLASSGRIEGIETQEGRIEARTVVVCAGASSKRLLAPLGIRLPIEPVKGYSISLARKDLGFLPNRPIVDDTAHLGVTPLGDHLRIAGTIEFDGYNPTLRPGRVRNLVSAFKGLFPEARVPEQLNAWCGFRPMSADSMPIVGGTQIGGLYVNSGHGALGWTLACGSARLLTDSVTGRPGIDGTLFATGRSFL
ncbi:D-amino acid dehydrogenase [Mesorhizobium sp. KR9-304]|uniref:D-amino acid dehydrogenase n=1 Tax=Mesorhizobium sp. KR9-304 TaxID=3156614 RepID=UPI0032B5B857